MMFRMLLLVPVLAAAGKDDDTNAGNNKDVADRVAEAVTTTVATTALPCWKDGSCTTTTPTDSCYNAYGRYAVHMDGSVNRPWNQEYDVTVEQCKARCEDGTWHGCKGFSREIDQHGVDQKGGCWWVTSSDLFFRDESGQDEEILYTRDAKGLRNATHDHLAGCCYRGVKTGYCLGNTAVCTVDCGSDSQSGLEWVKLAAMQNYAPALVQLGTMHLLGNSNIEIDATSAMENYFKPAAYAGDQDAQYYLAQAYKDGLFGVERDEQAAWMWYQLSKKKASAVGDAEALSDSTAGLAALVQRNDGNDGECDADCQTLVRAKVYEWSPKTDVCQLPGAEKTRDSFCSGFGTPTSTVTNDEVSHYMSCQCVCDEGYFNDPGDASGCLAGGNTTTTTQTTLLTTSTTTTISRNCKYQGGKFFGPWTGRYVGAGGNGDGIPMLSHRKSTVNGCAYYCVDNGGCLGFVYINPNVTHPNSHGYCYLYEDTKRMNLHASPYMTNIVSKLTIDEKMPRIEFHIKSPQCNPVTTATTTKRPVKKNKGQVWSSTTGPPTDRGGSDDSGTHVHDGNRTTVLGSVAFLGGVGILGIAMWVLYRKKELKQQTTEGTDGGYDPVYNLHNPMFTSSPSRGGATTHNNAYIPADLLDVSIPLL